MTLRAGSLLRRALAACGLVPFLRAAKRAGLASFDRARGACYRDPSLITSARCGDVAAIEASLAAGADIDQPDHAGDTPLHGAVIRGRNEAAACLLHHGADHGRPGRAGQPALAPALCPPEQLHNIRQHFRRYRSPAQRAFQVPREDATLLRTLRAQGLVRVSGLIGGEALARMRREFDAFVQHVDDLRAQGFGEFQRYDEEEHYWPDDQAYVTNNAFKYSDELARLCFEPMIRTLVEAYIGGKPRITRGVAMRYLPVGGRDKDMFGWHHDLEDQRLKMMVLLTDVGADDQYMGYVSGSHTLFHPLAMFRRNDCSVEYCARLLGDTPILRTTGAAGDVFLFDSNGAHRGSRFARARSRDAFFVEFSRDRANVWGGDVNAALIHELARDVDDPFEWMRSAPKKWETRTARSTPTWIETLATVERWT